MLRTIQDDEIHPDSEFEAQYSEVEVTPQTFPDLKARLYTKAPDADISGAEENITYRLYDDNDNLLQLEDVPVIKDGASIKKLDEYYKRTSTPVPPSKSDTGWSKNSVPAYDGTNPYLWNYEQITDTKDRTVETSDPALIDQTGNQIDSIVEKYLVSSSTTTPSYDDTHWSTTVPTITKTDKYLWNYEEIRYVNVSDPHRTTPAIIGAYGDTPVITMDGDFMESDGVAVGKIRASYLGRCKYVPSGTSITVYTSTTQIDGTPDTVTAYAGDFVSVMYSSGTTPLGKMYKYDGTNWIEDTDEGHEAQAMADMLMLADNLPENGATDLFLRRLVVAKAFIDRLFTQIVTIRSGGKIVTENFNPATSVDGFSLDYNGGKIECNNLVAKGGTIGGIVIEKDKIRSKVAAGESKLKIRYRKDTQSAWSEICEEDTNTGFYARISDDNGETWTGISRDYYQTTRLGTPYYCYSDLDVEASSQSLSYTEIRESHYPTSDYTDKKFLYIKHVVTNGDIRYYKYNTAYGEDAGGFCITKEGNVSFFNGTFKGIIEALSGVFNNIEIKGASKFTGEILSGPLELNNNGTPGVNFYGMKGESSSIFWTDNTRYPSPFSSQGWISVNPDLSYYGNYRVQSVNTGYLLQNGTFSYKRVGSSTEYRVILESSTTYPPVHNVPENFLFTTSSPDAYTFRLKNLPTSLPSGSGYVWNDNGTLKIS